MTGTGLRVVQRFHGTPPRQAQLHVDWHPARIDDRAFDSRRRLELHTEIDTGALLTCFERERVRRQWVQHAWREHRGVVVPRWLGRRRRWRRRQDRAQRLGWRERRAQFRRSRRAHVEELRTEVPRGAEGVGSGRQPVHPIGAAIVSDIRDGFRAGIVERSLPAQRGAHFPGHHRHTGHWRSILVIDRAGQHGTSRQHQRNVGRVFSLLKEDPCARPERPLGSVGHRRVAGLVRSHGKPATWKVGQRESTLLIGHRHPVESHIAADLHIGASHGFTGLVSDDATDSSLAGGWRHRLSHIANLGGDDGEAGQRQQQAGNGKEEALH